MHLIAFSDFSYKERSINEFLFERIEAIPCLSPCLAAELLHKFVTLHIVSLFSWNSLVHDPKEFEISWEKDVCFSSSDQVCVIVNFLMRLWTFFRNYGCIYSRHPTEQLVEITNDHMVIGHLLLELMKQAQEIGGQKQSIEIECTLGVSLHEQHHESVHESLNFVFFPLNRQRQVVLQTLFDEWVFQLHQLLLVWLQVNLCLQCELLWVIEPDNPIVRQIVKDLEKQQITQFARLVILVIHDVLVYYA